MPILKQMPHSIDDWLSQLDQVRLPIATRQYEAARRALLDSRKSLHDIAEQMQNSPTLALLILREANRNLGSLGEPAESLETALNRLGLKRCETLLEQMPIQDETAINPALRQLQLISLHAAQQASGLFAGRLARLRQEIHWGSLLFLAPLWALVAAHPPLFELWERRVLGNGEPVNRVAREQLGVSLPVLCLAVARHWRLPEWICQGYRLLTEDRRLLVKALHIARDSEHPLHQQQMLDKDANLRRWLTQPANSILLANGLAASSHHNWNCEHHLRWQRLTALYLNTALPDLQQRVHQQAAQSARLHARPELWHPAEALLWPWNSCRLQARQAAPPPDNSQQDPWRQHCARLLATPSVFSNVLQLTDSALQALQACGMQRILILLTDRAHSRLQAQQSTGLPESARQLRLDPTQSQVLRRLLAEPGQLRLSPANMAQVTALLPGTLKALFDGDYTILRSLAAGNGRVVMLLVADRGGSEIDTAQLQIFARTAQCIEHALGAFARRSI